MSKKSMKESFGLLEGIKVRFSKVFVPENSDKKINEILHGGSPMKRAKEYLKEHKTWWSIWILIFMLTTALATCSELKIEYEYKTPQVIKNILGNK